MIMKVMRYFPLIPRLILAYKNPYLAKLYKWHASNRLSFGLASPADGIAWKHLEEMFPDKMNDPRTLRLALAMDGVSPFTISGHATSYSVWPMMMTTYNVPPWKSTKPGHAWIVMLLPGKTSCYLFLIVIDIKFQL